MNSKYILYKLPMTLSILCGIKLRTHVCCVRKTLKQQVACNTHYKYSSPPPSPVNHRERFKHACNQSQCLTYTVWPITLTSGPLYVSTSNCRPLIRSVTCKNRRLVIPGPVNTWPARFPTKHKAALAGTVAELAAQACSGCGRWKRAHHDYGQPTGCIAFICNC